MNDLPNIDATLAVLDASALPTWPGSPAVAKATKAAKRHTRRVTAKRFARIEQNRAAAEHLVELPPVGIVIHGAMSGSYSGWSLIEAVAQLAAAPIAELFISTLGVSRQNVEALFDLLDSRKVNRATVCISHYFRHSDKDIYADLSNGLTTRGQRCHILRNHAKLCLFAIGQDRYVLEGSFNCRSSMNHEQFLIANDPELWSFHRSWIEELITTTEATECTKH